MWFDIAKDIERVHAAEYVCPVCRRMNELCRCPSFEEAAAEESYIIDRDNADEINRGSVI